MQVIMEEQIAFNKFWEEICELYNLTKKYQLLAEELAGSSYIQPILEQKNALDHIIKAYLESSKSMEEANKQLGGAKAHLYRAFWDVADWLSIICRESVYKLLRKKSPKKIADACPEYYSEIRKKLVDMPEAISDMRFKKDDKIQYVKEYCDILDELVKDYKHIANIFG